MKSDTLSLRISSFTILTTLMLLGFAVLAVRLKSEQVDSAAAHKADMSKQSFRTIRTAGMRGRILDRRGLPLADNRVSLSLEAYPESFRTGGGKGAAAVTNLVAALDAMAEVLGRKPDIALAQIEKHMKYELARPITAWHNLTETELARWAENSREHPGFGCIAETTRVYPKGSLAAHVIGFVGRDRVHDFSGEAKANYTEREPNGREGLERRYDDFLRGMPGEDRVIVDARGYATGRETVVKPAKGFDIRLTIDSRLQAAAEAQLAGLRGACVIIDPARGDILACASAPAFNPNDCSPVFPKAVYDSLASDSGKPFLNRAISGLYAPGSTFKPITAIAALSQGWRRDREYVCEGLYLLPGMKVRCGRTWGHGPINLAHALRESCNPFFCSAAAFAGAENLHAAATAFGLGAKTGVDFPSEAAGIVPNEKWKMETQDKKWYSSDLAQMSIGQGQLLVTPLQMACAVAAMETGYLVTPHFNAAAESKRKPLPFPKAHLDAVREGMSLVINGGTGRRAGENVDAVVMGKTGTAEVGQGASRRKNTWFIACAKPTETSAEKLSIAVALVIENGETGGTTAAPKVGAILRSFYGEKGGEE